MRKLFLFLFLLPLFASAQTKEITLEDIYKKGTFRGEFVPASFDETKKDPEIKAEDLKDESGKSIGEPDDVIRSASNPNIVLIRKNIEQIYRHSSKATVYMYDMTAKKLTKLDSEKLMHPTLSPDGSKIAFVKNNNLVLYDIATKSARAITTDGKWNFIINGNCDWVYEEEFSFTQAYQWSPKGNHIAYYRFDESKVKEYQFTQFDNTYNKQYTYKYPKAGDENSKVEIHIYDITTNKDVKADFEQGDIYIPRIKWTQDDNSLVVFWMNRHQNELKLLLTNAKSGDSHPLYQEKNKYYIDINDDWQFTNDGKSYLFTSEMNGFNHIYMYSMDGKTKTQISKGNYEVTEINGVDEANKRIFYTMAYPRPMDRNLFVTDFAGKKTTQLTQGEAWHRTVLNSNFTQFYDYRSDLNTPQVVTLNSIVADKKKGISTAVVKTVNENPKLKGKIEEYGIAKAEFIKVPNSKGDTLNGWMLKPANFDPSKKYPVLFCNYGGPGSQQVANRFGSVSMWHQLLAQKGFIVVSVDNTGTGFRGEEFKKKTYLQLGKFEIEDQIDAAKYIGNMSFVDKNNIGHWGWSYGGFMTTSFMLNHPGVFKVAVAGGPVIDWKYYEIMYTERYMDTPQENPDGYDATNLTKQVGKLKGKLLLIHGMQDNVVLQQHSVLFVKAAVDKAVQVDYMIYPGHEHNVLGKDRAHLYQKVTDYFMQYLP